MSDLRICQIPGNSDIAGVGVRASVYVQACLAGVNLLYMLHAMTYSQTSPPSSATHSKKSMALSTAPIRTSDPEDPAIAHTRSKSPTPTSSSTNSLHAYLIENADYLSMAKALERSLFMVGFAVILSAILEARSDSGLSAYHALIVLNISQINNWAGFLLLLLRGGFRTEGTGWIKRVFITRKSLTTSLLCIAHSTMMSGLGLYFWAKPSPFVAYAAESSEPCRPEVYFWVFGAVNTTNSALRISSLVFYAISIIPIFGLYFLTLIPVLALFGLALAALVALVLVCAVLVFFAAIYLFILEPIIKFIFKPLLRISLVQDVISYVGDTVLSPIADHLITLFRRLQSKNHGILNGPSYASLVTFPMAIFFSTPLIYSIVSTELIIRINAENVEREAENKWTYGQTLALFSALVAISLYIHELIKILRRKRRRAMVQGPKRPQYLSRDAQTEWD